MPPTPAFGEPLDPDRLRTVFTELAKVVALQRDLTAAREELAELRTRKLTLADLPFAALRNKLETQGDLDAALLLAPGSLARAHARDAELAAGRSD